MIIFFTFEFFSHLLDDSSRVKLSIIHGSPYDDYINANYIPVRTDTKIVSHSVSASVLENIILLTAMLCVNYSSIIHINV